MATANTVFNPDDWNLDMGITKEKEVEMKAYAAKLHAKYPKWKIPRIMNKVAEHFKIKLIKDVSNNGKPLPIGSQAGNTGRQPNIQGTGPRFVPGNAKANGVLEKLR